MAQFSRRPTVFIEGGADGRVDEANIAWRTPGGATDNPNGSPASQAWLAPSRFQYMRVNGGNNLAMRQPAVFFGFLSNSVEPLAVNVVAIARKRTEQDLSRWARKARGPRSGVPVRPRSSGKTNLGKNLQVQGRKRGKRFLRAMLMTATLSTRCVSEGKAS